VRVVLDTNTVVSAILFPRGRLAWIREPWTAGRLIPVVCPGTVRELVRVLSCPKFDLDERGIEIVLAAYLPYTETLDDDPASELVRCIDPDDQIFLDLALCAHANVVVSGDRALVELSARVPFAVETPAEFRNRFDV